MENQIQHTTTEEPKKSRWWIWLIVILLVMGVGIGAYFLLTGDSSPVIGVGNSIPQPPALPS